MAIGGQRGSKTGKLVRCVLEEWLPGTRGISRRYILTTMEAGQHESYSYYPG